MNGLDLTAGDTVSGPPPRAPVGPAALQVGPGPLRGSGAATWRRTPARYARSGQPRGSGLPSPGEGSDPPHGTLASRGGPDSLPREGVRPTTWRPGGCGQAGTATCPKAASLPWYASPTTALNAKAARAEAAHGQTR
jgi:hypothetical protein